MLKENLRCISFNYPTSQMTHVIFSATQILSISKQIPVNRNHGKKGKWNCNTDFSANQTSLMCKFPILAHHSFIRSSYHTLCKAEATDKMYLYVNKNVWFYLIFICEILKWQLNNYAFDNGS